MNTYWHCLVAGIITLLLALGLTWSMIKLAPSRGWVEKPKLDRWSKSPAVLYGGVAIVLSFIMGCVILALLPSFGLMDHSEMIWLIVGGLCVFAVGLRDDAKPLNPLVKLVGQIASIMPFVIGVGLKFPLIPFVFLMPIIVFWMLALSNSFNLLDNMDGLCAGSSAVVGISLCVYGAYTGQHALCLMSILVATSCLGFLYFNFVPKSPAKIFMGDCGSLFLGYMLSGLAVLAVYPSGKISVLEGVAKAIPALLIMALPLFDTTLVVLIRKREGRAISQGGRDHSSHRLVYAGQSEKRAVIILYGLGLLGGIAAVLLSVSGMPYLSFAALALEIVLLIRFGLYLNGFSGNPATSPQANQITVPTSAEPTQIAFAKRNAPSAE